MALFVKAQALVLAGCVAQRSYGASQNRGWLQASYLGNWILILSWGRCFVFWD